jgi:beta-glucosidase-like glycosyl hydrolase
MITFINMYNRAMQNYYRFIVPRLNGTEVRKNLSYYRSLVKKGIAGFIIFGGELKTLRRYVALLQEEAELPLIIASDLERGLGQQVKGGTLFPPAMALASAVKGRSASSPVSDADLKLFRNACRAMADEARYAGINTIFAPVLDINTNPKNPIISVRAFGEDAETVSFFGCEMIKAFQERGIAACGKHFPGHGDTGVDSHIRLPVVDKSLKSLEKNELRPFRRAMEEQVKMIMLGHLSVPALDSRGIPVSLSERAVRFLRKKMKYEGILITDAMNMGGIGMFSEEEAAFMSLDAGADILLHPTAHEKIVSYLKEKNAAFDEERLRRFRAELRSGTGTMPNFEAHGKLADVLSEKAIRLTGDFRIREELFLLILNDDEQRKGNALARSLREKVSLLKIRVIMKGEDIREIKIPEGSFVVAAVFSETKAWKGGVSDWLNEQIECIKARTGLFASFGSPYLFDSARGKTSAVMLYAYGDSESAQKAVARIIEKKAAGFLKKR